jgi:hypothetical protein
MVAVPAPLIDLIFDSVAANHFALAEILRSYTSTTSRAEPGFDQKLDHRRSSITSLTGSSAGIRLSVSTNTLGNAKSGWRFASS